MWAQPITVQFQEADISLYPELFRSTSGASETGSASPSSAGAAGAAATTSPSSQTAATTATTRSGQPTVAAPPRYGLSTSAKTGIGVGVAASILLTIGIVGFILWGKRRRKATMAYEDLVTEKDGKPVSVAEKDGKEIIGELPADRGTKPPVEMEA